MNEGFSFRYHSDMGIPIPKTLDIWASSVTLTQIAKVIEKGMPISLGFWEWGCPYDFNNTTSQTRRNWVELTFAKTYGTVTGQ